VDGGHPLLCLDEVQADGVICNAKADDVVECGCPGGRGYFHKRTCFSIQKVKKSRKKNCKKTLI
jgi:hypothetical protein